jgi:phospholipid N-methyltransferase
MAKLSKQKWKLHLEAQAMVDGTADLSFENREFILKNWSPLAQQNVGVAGIFFTPTSIAYEMQIEVPHEGRILDLFAGTGRLAFNTTKYAYEDDSIDMVCIENNPEFVKVGKRVLPQATWIRGDAFDRNTYDDIGQFRCVISNPPYGISSNGNGNWLTRGPSQYMAAEVAMMVADYGVFVLNQSDCPFKMSGVHSHEKQKCEKYEKWHKKTGIEFMNNCGLDLSMYDDDWEGTRQRVEVVLIQKGEKYKKSIIPAKQKELF